MGKKLVGEIKRMRTLCGLKESTGSTIVAYHQSQSKKPFKKFRTPGQSGYRKSPISVSDEGIYFSTDKETTVSRYNHNDGLVYKAIIDTTYLLDLGEYNAMYFDGTRVHSTDIITKKYYGDSNTPLPDIELEKITPSMKQWLITKGYKGIWGMKGFKYGTDEICILDQSAIIELIPLNEYT